MVSSPLLKQAGISWGLLATVLGPDILNIQAVFWSYGKLYVIYAGATNFNRYNYPLRIPTIFKQWQSDVNSLCPAKVGRQTTGCIHD